MTAKEQLARIEDAFLSYEKVQYDHLRSLETKELPDIAAMTQQRTTVFKELKTALDTYMERSQKKADQSAIASLSNYETRVADLMMLDDRISAEIRKHKGKLKENLNHMNRGKKAMQGYRNAGGTSRNTPRVLSMNR